MTVADLVVGALQAAGARALFGVPGGGGNLDLIAAAGRGGLPFVLTSTETAAAIAAIAQAEVSGGIGACLTTLGPGAASVTNGVACAFLERAPIVVFTDSQAGGARAAFEHQRLDHAAMMAPITKRSECLGSEDVMQLLTAVLHHATHGRPGPVHVDCPGGVASTPAPKDAGGYVEFAVDAPTAVERSTVRDLAAGARKPLVIAGLGARRVEDVNAVRALCARRRIPAMVTYKAKGVVPDDDPWFAGVFTNAAIEQAVIDESDLLVGIGLDPVELIPRAWKRAQPIVYCGRWRVEHAHVPFAAQLVTAIPDGVALIEDALGASEWDPERVRAHADGQRNRIRVTGAGFTAQRVVDVAAARLAATGRATVDAGAHMFAATMLWPVREPNGLLISNGLSTMGFALPAAIGAALIDRERPTVALTGDGGLLMCAAELLTAVREHLHLITIVFDDASLSLIEIKQQARRLPASGVALGRIGWPGLAESLGVAAWTASNEAELDRAIGAALQRGGPALIQAKIDGSNYGATLRAVRG
jgi:acetolactate synthase-1/2/3 large subunit